MAEWPGYGGIGAYGNKTINTSNLDYLSNNGIKFTDFPIRMVSSVRYQEQHY